MAFVSVARSNCISQMKLLLNEILENPEGQQPIPSDLGTIVQSVLNSDNFTPDIARWILTLWNEQTVRNLYKVKHTHIQMNDCAEFFF